MSALSKLKKSGLKRTVDRTIPPGLPRLSFLDFLGVEMLMKDWSFERSMPGTDGAELLSRDARNASRDLRCRLVPFRSARAPPCRGWNNPA